MTDQQNGDNHNINSSNDSFFYELDHGFSNYLSNELNPPYLYKTTNLYIQQQQSFELPIPISSGSTVKYKFSTEGGDIAFSSVFYSNNRPPQMILEPNRVQSQTEPIIGIFKNSYDGTLVLIFDNSYSWFTPKYLTYSVELHQPAFDIADKNRCIKSKSLLETTQEDTRKAEILLAKTQSKLKILRQEIPVLEEKLAALQFDLNEKKILLNNAEKESKDVIDRIRYNIEKKNGLCIRCLNKNLLSIVLSYLGINSSALYVCKYWYLILKEQINHNKLNSSYTIVNNSINNDSNNGNGNGTNNTNQNKLIE